MKCQFIQCHKKNSSTGGRTGRNAESDSTLVNEVVSRLNLASTETKYTEYKIGFTYFNTSSRYRYNEGKLNFSNVSQIAKVASAMTNIKRDSQNPGKSVVLNRKKTMPEKADKPTQNSALQGILR